MKKVGIFSGSFDPVHDGHIEFALQAATQCGLDKVFFMVEPTPRRKQGVRALEHREAMVTLAIKPHKNLSQIILGHDRFTVELTLPRLINRFKGARLNFLMGDDVFRRLPQWGNLSSLIKVSDFIVGSRSIDKAKQTQHQNLIYSVSGQKPKVHIILTDQNKLSSTTVRANLRRGNLTGICPPVKSYILQHGLYQSTGMSK